ncbi:hypothetical protein C0J52_04462 [Blattella germanica]|nr:hypothetical protein C0J52_04462 [Blattella germanica]
MCEQTEVRYLEGDVVWVKLGSCWWPGSVKDVDQLPEEILVSLKKKPIAAVKFFQEDTFEYVRNLNQICLYNCRRKHEFIKKGLDVYRLRRREGSSIMDKFPQDVATAEKLTGGNPDILRDEKFAPGEKPNYHIIFGDDKKSGSSPEKKIKTSNSSPIPNWKIRPLSSSANGRRSLTSLPVLQQPRQITHPRFINEIKDDSDHVVRIRQQPSSTPIRDDQASTPSSQYKCHQCDFTSTRLNVIVLHNKFHTADAAKNDRRAVTKGVSAGKSKSAESKISVKGKGRGSTSSPSDRSRARSKTVPANNDTPKLEKVLSRSAPKRKLADIKDSETTKEESSSKRQSPKSVDKQIKASAKKSPRKPIFGKRKGSKGGGGGGGEKPAKKKKNDDEIREKLLADWDEEDEEQEEKEIEKIKQELSKSEIGSTLNDEETPATSQIGIITENKDEIPKPKETSCFDFDDSEDANLGSELEERAKKFVETRKIPRILEDKSDSTNKRKSITEDIKSIISETPSSSQSTELPTTSISEPEELQIEKSEELESNVADSEDIEVAFKNLLDETTVPALPEVPELPIVKDTSPAPDVGNSTSLPDVVLDSNTGHSSHDSTTTSTSCLPEVTSVENSGGDHDYSIKKDTDIKEEEQEQSIKTENTEMEPSKDISTCENTNETTLVPVEDDEMELDINSMPVVMTDAIITEEPETKTSTVSMPIIDLLPTPEPSQPVSSESSISTTVSTPVTDVATILSTAPMPTSPPPVPPPPPPPQPALPETVVATTKTLVVTAQVPSSSGNSVVKTPIKTVKLQAATVSVAGSSVTVPSSALSTISKLKGTGAATVLSQKGPSGGKLVIVQASSSQQSRFTVGKTANQRVVKASQQQIVQQAVGGNKVVILTPQGGGQQKIITTALSPQQQRMLTASGKLQPQSQCIISSTGAILTPINPRSVMAKGTKLTPISQQQMRALQGGKQGLGAKFTMQSTQAKVILPSLQKTAVAQNSPVRVIGTLKPQSNTILIQTTQGNTVSGTVVGKSVVSTSGQLQAKIATTQSMTRLATTKPKILASPGIGSTVQRISVPTNLSGKAVQSSQGQQKLLGIRPVGSPRMVVQKIQAPVSAKSSSVGVLTNVSQIKKAPGVFQTTSTTQKISQPGSSTQPLQKTQTFHKVITSPQLKKATIPHQKAAEVNVSTSKRIPIVVSATNLQSSKETVTTQSLSSVQSVHTNVSVASGVPSHNTVSAISMPNVQLNPLSLPTLQTTSSAVTTAASVLVQDQMAQVVTASTPEQIGDSGGATYVLVTIDDSAALQQYDNSSILSFDGTTQPNEAQPSRTLYIDPSSISSSGDLENIILTIDNSAPNPGAVINLGQTNAIPVNPATTISGENTSSVFNIAPSHPSTPQHGGSNQDILAEALANTQVFQPDNTIQDSLTVVNSSQSTVMTPRLLEPSSLLASTPASLHQATMLLPSLSPVLPPPNPAGVLETSLTLNQPIMTPLEVPSSAVPTLQTPPPVPSSLELPLTITQPSLSVTSASYSNLSITASQNSEESSVPTSSLPVSTGSFNPSMPLLSEETDSQNEISIHISEQQQSITAPISRSSDQSETHSITSYQDNENSLQGPADSHMGSLLPSADDASPQNPLPSYADISEPGVSEKDKVPDKQIEVEDSLVHSLPTTYDETTNLLNADSIIEDSTSQIQCTRDNKISPHDDGEIINPEVMTPSSPEHSISASEDPQKENGDHSSDCTTADQNSFSSTAYKHVIDNVGHVDASQTDNRVSFPTFTEACASELPAEQKQDMGNSYDSSVNLADDSQYTVSDEAAKTDEKGINVNYLPISNSTSETEEKTMDQSDDIVNTQNLQHGETVEASSIVCSKTADNLVENEHSFRSFTAASDNLSGDTVDTVEHQPSLLNIPQSMPLLVDEPMTETVTDSSESCRPSELKSPESDIPVDDVELSERSKDQGSLSSKSLPRPGFSEGEPTDMDEDLPPAFSTLEFSSPSEKNKEFTKEDVVWVKCQKKLYWPAVVTNVDKKKKKAYIKTVNSPRKCKGVKVSFQSLIGFDDKEKNKSLLDMGKEVSRDLQKAYDRVKYFYIKKQQQQELSAVRYLTFEPDAKKLNHKPLLDMMNTPETLL